jgi:hypothetical protein
MSWSELERFVADVEANAALQRAWQDEQVEHQDPAQANGGGSCIDPGSRPWLPRP